MVMLAVLSDTNDVVSEAGDAMDVDVTSSRASKGASEISGRNRDSEFECDKFGLGVRSRQASVFEGSKRRLAETRCVDMANVDLNALEMGAVVAREKSQDACSFIFAGS